MFEKEYSVRYSEVAQNGKLSLSSLVSYFQDTTMFHSDSVGQGINSFRDKNLAWLLESWHIKINEYPKYAQTIRSRTWATDFSSVYGYRDFEIVDKDDNVLAIASSAWFLYDGENQKIQRITPDISAVYSPEPRFVFGSATNARLRAPNQYDDICKYTVERRDLDTNNHVNNVHYIDYVTDTLPKDYKISELRVSYKKAAVEGDTICVGLCKGDDADTYVLHDENGSIYAILEIK